MNNLKRLHWQRPKTARIALQPPLSEKVVMLRPDFVISIHDLGDGSNYDFRAIGLALFKDISPEWPTYWFRAQIQMRDDGLPIPVIIAPGEVEFRCQAFCAFEDLPWPTTFVRWNIINHCNHAQEVYLRAVLRTLDERLLDNAEGDGYCSFNPTIRPWYTGGEWAFNNNHFKGPNGEYAIWECDKNIKVRFIERESFAEDSTLPPRDRSQFCNVLSFSACIEQGQNVNIDWCISDRPVAKINYEKRRIITERKWYQALQSLHQPPATVPEVERKAYRHVVTQLLQMLAHPKRSYTAWPRQGYLSRGVWPSEAVECLTALDRIGLSKWAERGYEFFLNRQITADTCCDRPEDIGRFRGAGSPTWVCETGQVLLGLADHAIQTGDRNWFIKVAPQMLLACIWINNQRISTLGGEYKGNKIIGVGLLPPGQPHDWPISGQFWCFNDGLTYMGLARAAEAFARFGHPEAPRIRNEEADYRTCLLRILPEACYEDPNHPAEIFVTNLLGCSQNNPPVGAYFGDGPMILFKAGILSPDHSLLSRIENYWFRQGWMSHGFTGLMTDSLIDCGAPADPWFGHTWYTSLPDSIWFNVWLARGELKKAKQTYDATLKYSMSEEFQMIERYADNDPSFLPWQPNASANGRFIHMSLAKWEQIDNHRTNKRVTRKGETTVRT